MVFWLPCRRRAGEVIIAIRMVFKLFEKARLAVHGFLNVRIAFVVVCMAFTRFIVFVGTRNVFNVVIVSC